MNLLVLNNNSAHITQLEIELKNQPSPLKFISVSSPDEALAEIQNEFFDAIVTEVSGTDRSCLELLNTIKQEHSRTARIVFIRDRMDKQALRTISSSHYVIEKSVAPKEAFQQIDSALEFYRFIRSQRTLKVISSIKALPPLPENYIALSKLLEGNDCSLKDVRKVVERDIAIASKVMQLANSALFKARGSISSIESAITTLGLDSLRLIVLAAEIFSTIGGTAFQKTEAQYLWEHSLSVSLYSFLNATNRNFERQTKETIMVAGLLHDVGKVVFLSQLPREYEECRSLAIGEKISAEESELRVLGSHHGEVGGYLLESWGLPVSIIRAVAYHHSPLLADDPSDEILSTVYFSNVISHLLNDEAYVYNHKEFDDYLNKLNIKHEFRSWKDSCEKF